MPLDKLHKINNNRYIAIWHITESVNDLFGHLPLTDDELNIYGSFKLDNKKAEWLACRYAAQHLCLKMNIPYKGIIKDPNGKPCLTGSNAELSLSHSFPYVAAILDAKAPVGIDIEQPKDKLIRIRHKFLNDNEIACATDDIKKLTVYWCAKEALYKIQSSKSLSLKGNLVIEPFTLNTTDLLIGRIIVHDIVKTYTLQYKIEDEYVLAYNLD